MLRFLPVPFFNQFCLPSSTCLTHHYKIYLNTRFYLTWSLYKKNQYNKSITRIIEITKNITKFLPRIKTARNKQGREEWNWYTGSETDPLFGYKIKKKSCNDILVKILSRWIIFNERVISSTVETEQRLKTTPPSINQKNNSLPRHPFSKPIPRDIRSRPPTFYLSPVHRIDPIDLVFEARRGERSKRKQR